jgi:hypothetical protein
VSLTNLENLVATGKLQREPRADDEFEGLVRSGERRLRDAGNADNAEDSRFDLAYNAAHAFALAALRWHGYRPESRYIVFHALEHTLGLDKATCRLLAKCHDQRNRIEYGGVAPVDEKMLAELIRAAATLRAKIRDLAAP